MSDGGQERQGEGRGGGRGWQVSLALELIYSGASLAAPASIAAATGRRPAVGLPPRPAAATRPTCASLAEFNRQHSSGVHLDGSSSTMCSVTASATDAGFYGMNSGTVSDM